ncbi:autotransporter outer membrane beta-barrel domain-containing protein [Glycocaulis sp.]|uniref:autotransporter outer membrane beta-barrel domain-containing protein n=1 Tax=Glycocaulis sp. TaxID=1969725 RepID=UPI003F72A807
MRRRLLAAASLVALCSSPVWADEEISNERTSPVRTSNAGDIVITSSGRVTLTGNSGPAVVIDSDNSVETRSGSEITINNRDGAVGIFAESGRTGDIVHNGRISLADSEVNGNQPLDEAFGNLTEERDKTGILVGSPGGAAFVGNVTIGTGGAINVTGQDSYGVRIASDIDGDITFGGSVNVVGENSIGVSVEGNTDGNVRVLPGGAINTLGAGSNAVSVTGDVEGGVSIAGQVRSNGFRINERARQAIFEALADREAGDIAEDSRLAGSAVIIAGSVRDGVFIAGPTSTNTAGGSIQVTGSAPALTIRPGENASGPITIGEVVYDEPDTSEGAEEDDIVTVERGFGLVIDGNVNAAGVFDGIDTRAILISGRDVNGNIQAVILAEGGMQITGTATATSFDGHAQAVTIGEGAQMAGINNSGTISALVFRGYEDDGFADPAYGEGTAIALSIESGSDVGRIDNSGLITATLNVGGSAATGIVISSDSVTDISNTGRIRAITTNYEATNSPTLIAVDARTMTSGLTISQSAPADEDANAPAIIGDVYFGAGDDTLSLTAGRMDGNVYFGAGADRLIVHGAEFHGSLNSGDGQLEIDVEDATLALGLTGQTHITSARFGDGGVLNLVLDRDSTSSAALIATGEIAFEDGSELSVSLSELVGQSREYRVLSAGTLTVADESVILEAVDTPFLYSATLVRASDDPDTLVLSLERKTAEQIGFDPNRAAVYDAALTLFEDVSSLGNAIASIRDADAFYNAYDQLLPEYAASAIQFALASHDAAAGALSTRLRNARLSPSELAGLWIQEFGYYADRTGSALGPGYRGYGVGLAVGIDRPLGPFYAVGVSFAGAASEIEQIGLNHDPMTTLMGQVSGYAAIDFGGIDASFTASAGINRFETQRNIGIGNYTGSTSADWGGWHYSLSAQAGRDIPLGNWVVRPEASLTWLSISEDDFNEIALDNTAPELALFVDSRTTSALTGGATVTVARMFQRSGSWWMPYARVGYRGDFSGNSGETTARFGQNGTPFTLRAAELPSAGLLAGLGFSAGSNYTTFTFAYDADYRDEYVNHVLRLVLRMNF